MDTHKTKAAHSLAEFAREMGAVVLGILIALGLEQAVAAQHDARLVEDARAALRSEVAIDVRTYVYRLAVGPCVLRRLGEVEAVMADLDAGRHVSSVADFGRPVGRGTPLDAWRALSASGAVSHMEPKELIRNSDYYFLTAEVSSWNTLAGQDWSVVKLMVGDPNRLTPADRSQIRIAANHLRALENIWQLIAPVQLARARALGVPTPPPTDVSRTPECQPLQRG
jgi:hypothetical protein